MSVQSPPVPLSFLLAERDQEEPVTPFSATLHGQVISVTAVLERTVTYELANSSRWDDRHTAKATDILVDAEDLRWRERQTKIVNSRWRRHNKVHATQASLAEQHAKHDRLVAENNAQVERLNAAEKERDRAAARAAAASRNAAPAEERTQKSAAPIARAGVTDEAPPPLPVTSDAPAASAPPPAATQRCKVCGKEQPIDRFQRHWRTGAPYTTCLDCVSRKQIAVRAAQVAALPPEAKRRKWQRRVAAGPTVSDASAAVVTKPCSVCGVEKPLEMFRRTSLTADGRLARCKSCLGQAIHKGMRSKEVADPVNAAIDEAEDLRSERDYWAGVVEEAARKHADAIARRDKAGERLQSVQGRLRELHKRLAEALA